MDLLNYVEWILSSNIVRVMVRNREAASFHCNAVVSTPLSTAATSMFSSVFSFCTITVIDWPC